jgi:hypothetical protein
MEKRDGTHCWNSITAIIRYVEAKMAAVMDEDALMHRPKTRSS